MNKKKQKEIVENLKPNSSFKNIIINILWFCLNKLDKSNVVKGIEIKETEVNIKLNKKYYRRGEWTNLAITTSFWILFKKEEKEPVKYQEIAIYSKGLKKKEIKELAK